MSVAVRPSAPPWLKAAFGVVVLVVLGLPVAAEVVDWFDPGFVPPPKSLDAEVMDQPAKEFTLTTLDGDPVHLADLRGKTVFLNFWATWCPPCVEELPSMVALRAALAGYDFEILAVSEDESPEDVRRFFGGVMPDFPVVMDQDQRVTREWGTFKFPETYVVDPEGRVRAKFAGPRKWDTPDSIAYFQSLSG